MFIRLKHFSSLVLGMLFLLVQSGCADPSEVTSSAPVSQPVGTTASDSTETPAQAPMPAASQYAATPGEATPDSLLDLPYTEDNPLTDPEEILQILDELQERELAWFSRPGWYRFTTDWPLGRDYTRTRYVLTSVISENRDCLEQFAYFEQNGIILPYTIHLDDGSFGSITHAVDGTFQVNNMLLPEEASSCDLGNGNSIGVGTEDGNFILHDEASQFRKASNSVMEGIQTDFRAWVKEVDGKQTLVLVYDITIEDPALRGGVMDPTTGIFSPAMRTLRFQ